MGLWRYSQYLILAAVTAALIFILSRVGFFEIWDHIKSAQGIFLLLAFASMFLYHFFLALNYKIFFRMPLHHALLVVLSGEFFNVISPGAHVGGEPLKGYLLSKLTGKDFTEQFSAVLSLKLLDGIWYLFFGALSLVFGMLFVR